MMDLDRFLAPYRIEDGKRFSLKDHDPGDTHELGIEKSAAKEYLRLGIERLTELQDMLYAQNRWSVLLIFQAMDAAGKDSAIKHVMSGVNPQGVQVFSFKRPSAEELDHDFLWRCARNLPERGRIGVFNRSYYEEVLVVRVHQEILASQHLPPSLVGEHIFGERLEDIAGFERYLARQGTLILKFFLNVSKAEQKKRFLKRLDDPEKHWKFEAGDLAERRHWDAYMDAYQEAIRATATPQAPWYVVPADNKWFTRLVVAGAIVDSMRRLDLHYPEVSEAERAKFAEYRRALEAE
ncbi:polyphosphate kinase 2 family protein [Geminicoccus harenae]|uniref:polyphosphate kinase 2 family protein n=1 Tax=Geminicoccus harenae TaxID=2498453 RepID=UPI00168A4BC4|nr:polyphosphate kinase 2 family protein [Geminicoccus harenae]